MRTSDIIACVRKQAGQAYQTGIRLDIDRLAANVGRNGHADAGTIRTAKFVMATMLDDVATDAGLNLWPAADAYRMPFEMVDEALEKARARMIEEETYNES